MVTELYLLMYILMFAAAVKLRYSQPKAERLYKVPGGKVGMWIVAGVGTLGAILTMIVGVLPPKHIAMMNRTTYVVIMILGVILFSLGPSIILLFQKPSWKMKLEHETI